MTRLVLPKYLLKAICKTEIRFDRRSVVSHRVEESLWLKANDSVTLGSPSNLKISLIAEIASMAGAGRINEGSASKGIYSVVRRFPPVPVPGYGSCHVCLLLELKYRMQIDLVLRRQRLGCKVCATGEKGVEGPKGMI